MDIRMPVMDGLEATRHIMAASRAGVPKVAAAGEALLAPAVTKRLIEAFARRPASVARPVQHRDRGAIVPGHPG